MVRAHLRLKLPDVSAAQKLGTAFLRGLSKRHTHDWLGPFTVDVHSVRFAEVLVDSPLAAPTPVSSDTYGERHDQHPDFLIPTQGPSQPQASVGWGQWGPWSACSPCSPQYDQIRTRQCRLEAGRGLFINSVEPCMKGNEGEAGDMETRSCQCSSSDQNEEELPDITSPTPISTSTTTSTTTTTTPLSILPPFREQENSEQDSFSHEASESGELFMHY